MLHHETERALPRALPPQNLISSATILARFFPPSTWALKTQPSAFMKANQWPLPAPPEAENLPSLSSGYLDQPPKVS